MLGGGSRQSLKAVSTEQLAAATAALDRDRFPIGPRAALKHLDFHPSPERLDAEFPFLLITGRTLYQFNAATKAE